MVIEKVQKGLSRIYAIYAGTVLKWGGNFAIGSARGESHSEESAKMRFLPYIRALIDAVSASSSRATMTFKAYITSKAESASETANEARGKAAPYRAAKGARQFSSTVSRAVAWAGLQFAGHLISASKTAESLTGRATAGARGEAHTSSHTLSSALLRSLSPTLGAILGLAASRHNATGRMALPIRAHGGEKSESAGGLTGAPLEIVAPGIIGESRTEAKATLLLFWLLPRFAGRALYIPQAAGAVMDGDVLEVS